MSASPTPMMKQYREAKEKHPGMLLLFRMGDFYELFGEDAQVAAPILGIALTSRDKSIPMAGVPHHALDKYLHKLLHAGHHVAICDQVEDAAEAKGLVRREVTRIVTPGTVTEDELLDPRECNYLAAFCVRGNIVGLAWGDPSTGHFLAADFASDRFLSELNRLAPAECLVSETVSERLSEIFGQAQPKTEITVRPDWTFDPSTSRQGLERHFQVQTFAGFGFDDDQPCLTAAGALLLYLQETLKTALAHLHRLRRYRQDDFVLLDDVTRRSLELTRTLRDNGRDGSLLSVLDRTVTPMGARLLQEWLLAPLAQPAKTEQRLDAVGEFVEHHTPRNGLRELLSECTDLQRLTSRVSTGRASPRDLGAIGRTLRLLPRIKAKVTGRKSSLLQELEGLLELFPDLRQTLDRALVDELPLSPRDGGVIRSGYDAELDELSKIAKGGKDWLANYQAEEIKRTGINTLKVGFNKVHGYYIEITHAHADKVPDGYVRRQTLKNAERYITPQLKEYEEKVLGAEEKLKQREYELFVQLREEVAKQTDRILRSGDVLAALDVLAGLAELAVARQYVRPEICAAPVLHVGEGRHPVLDQTLPPGTFVPNDTALDTGGGYFWLVTGPNMAGKSVYIRQVALLTLMAQAGSFVPAREMRVGVVDRIFTRVGASDELSRGQSTFMVEMTEAANILNNATDRSLVILDEIGRGTSTYDGVSLAWAVTEYLHNEIGCRALFATHYHELAQLAETLPGLRNYNAQVQEFQDDIVFLHKIAPGSADKSYGIHVAQLAGVPAEVLQRARIVLCDLESHQVKSKNKMISGRKHRTRKSLEEQMMLFEAEVSSSAPPPCLETGEKKS